MSTHVKRRGGGDGLGGGEGRAVMQLSTHLDIRPNHHHPNHDKNGQEND